MLSTLRAVQVALHALGQALQGAAALEELKPSVKFGKLLVSAVSVASHWQAPHVRRRCCTLLVH